MTSKDLIKFLFIDCFEPTPAGMARGQEWGGDEGVGLQPQAAPAHSDRLPEPRILQGVPSPPISRRGSGSHNFRTDLTQSDALVTKGLVQSYLKHGDPCY